MTHIFLDDISLDKILTKNPSEDEERTKETITTPVISDCESETPSDKPNGLLPPKTVLETITEKSSDDKVAPVDTPAKDKTEAEVIKTPEKLSEDGKLKYELFFCIFLFWYT